jgi:hypothetical protein
MPVFKTTAGLAPVWATGTESSDFFSVKREQAAVVKIKRAAIKKQKIL